MIPITERQSGIRDVEAGNNVTVIQPSNLFECILGNDVFVGPFVEIQKGAIVGNRTRIQSHSFVCDCVSIGSDCFIGHGVMFINDTFSTGSRAMGDKSLYKNTLISDHVTIGSNATILPVNICSNVIIGAGSVVVKDITDPGIYAGNPAKFIRTI